MKPVSVVEAYTTKLCHSLSIEKMYWNDNWNQQVLFEVCLLFVLLLHFSIFIIMNIQCSKQSHYTWSCL